MRRLCAFPVIAVALCLAAGGPALADSNPSADEIVKGLRPTGPISGASRGINPIGPSSGGSHAPALSSGGHRPAPEPVVNADGAAPSVNLTVMFATGSARLTPAATRTLDELGHALSSPSLAAYRFRIEGHTDTVGAADLNRALSEQRANAVVDYLVARYNIERSRLQAVGMGADGLLIPTPPETPEPRNRRVQVVNVGT